MKKLQYSYLPADSAAALNSRETKTSVPSQNTKTPPPPDEATVAKLNALAREYPFCAWGKAGKNNIL
jgi:hypothetical protein